MDASPVPDDARPRSAMDLGSVGAYRVAGASVLGRGHALQGRPRDDAFVLAHGGDPPSWWFVAVADGAGSRPLSRHGADAATLGAAECAVDALFTGVPLAEAVHVAARAAWIAQAERAHELGLARDELSSTLLLLACALEGDRVHAATFQVGDGLVAWVDEAGAFQPLATADDQDPSGTIFLDNLPLEAPWHARLRAGELPAVPRGLVVITDGVADDLIPWSANGPVIAAELDAIAAAEDDAGERIAQLLGYEKKGSFDDRTLVAAWRRGGPR